MFETITDFENYLQDRDKFGIKLGLERMKWLLEQLDHPESDIPIIHVAGTNGKGSVIQLIANSLFANGYCVGVFTSPSFSGITGHYTLQNEHVNENILLREANKLSSIVQKMDENNMHPSSFEIVTTLAFLIFKHRVDIAIVETGMGGMLDTTNCVDPIVSVITTIAKDHQAFLGNTIEEIATHKAGIIKQNRPVVTGNLPIEALQVVQHIASEKRALLTTLTEHFFITDKKHSLSFHTENFSLPFRLQLTGRHQYDNAAVAIMTLYQLQQQYEYKLDWNVIETALYKTVLPGRFETIIKKPPIILDSAHNVAAIDAFIETVKARTDLEKPTVLFAGFKDKNLHEMIDRLCEANFTVKITSFEHPRAQSIASLKKQFKTTNDSITFIEDWKEALNEYLQHHKLNDPLFITGSLHFIIYVRSFILELAE